MTRPSILDEPHREAVVADLDRNFFVEAGAGTGKTKTLVDRIVNLVASGRLAEIHQLAAITFTEAAAAELRDRIRTELERAAEAGAAPRPDDERARCLAAARRIDEAVITTLHGFAQRILTEHPVAAGLPPAFEIEEGIPAELEFLDRWSAFVDELLADPSLDADLRVAITLRLSLPRLGEVARLLHDRWDRLGSFEPPPAPPVTVAIHPVLASLRAAVSAYRPHAEALDDKLVELFTTRVVPVLEVYEEAHATGDELELLRTLDAFGIPRPGNLGTAKEWGDDKAVAIEELRAAGEERDRLLVGLRSQALARLLPSLVRFTLDWAGERRRSGRLHFHDLLVLARDLLWSDASVRTALAQRWSVLLVDEFQDTDPLQVELVFALAAADPATLPADWDDIELGPGRVLVVGDPKQSIYGFRGADITLWNRTAARFGDDVVNLWQNFRSVSSILEWVNQVFERLMGEGDGDAQPAYVELASSRTSLDLEPDVVLLGGPAAAGVRASEVRTLEAAEIAAAVATMRATGQLVADRDGGAARPMRYDDVAVLVPTRAPIGPIERALDDADIPYRIESRSLVWRTDVVRELLALLTAIEDPADEVAVVAALRSPAFACTDTELVEWRQAGGRWDPGRRFPDELPERHPVAVAMATLRRWHDQRHWSTVDRLVDAVVVEARLVELTMAQRRPRDHWRRIRFIADQARAFVEAGGATLAQFLAWTSLQTDEEATAVETVVPEPDDDAVRILTVHGAKGLEFPVVVVAGLATARPTGLTGVLWRPDGPEMMLVAEGGGGAFATAGWDEAKAGAERFERAEAVRLLYVAATRARDELLVSLHHPAKYANDTHAKVLFDLCADMAGTWRPSVADAPPLLLAPPVGGPPPRTVEERQAWLDRHEAALASARRGWSVSPTGLAALAGAGAALGHADDAAIADEGDDDAGPAAPLDAGDEALGFAHRGGSAVGRAVHAVLETVPLQGTAPIGADLVAALAARHAAAEAVEPEVVAALATSALRSDAMASARAAGRLWREVPVVVPVGDRLLEGFVDLLYERPDGSLVVVDWKTDRARSEAEVDAALDRYRLQGAGYAVAVAGATRRSVAEVRFVFCRGGGQPAVERTVADLAGANAEVTALLR